MKIKQITLQDTLLLQELSEFATEIVKEHYNPILGTKQNEYMLELFQSVPALTSQIADGYLYYLVYSEAQKVAFMAFCPKEGRMYLSKFYIHKNFRKQGFSSCMLDFVIAKAKEDGLSSIFLNVNKYNSDSLAVYLHLGFFQIGEEKNDIGNGYYMDDFVLEYPLTKR